jgi:hypothetical protein
MRNLICAIALLACAQAGPGTEPGQRFVLEVAGQSVEIEEGRPFVVKLAGKDIPMKLTAQPHRVFEAAGLRFQYARHCTFEYDADPDGPTWTLDGSMTTLMITLVERQDPAQLLAATVAELVEAYGKQTRITPVAVTLAGKKREGKRLRFEMDGAALKQDVFVLDTKEGTAVFLIQDILDEGNATEETRRALTLLEKTLEIR